MSDKLAIAIRALRAIAGDPINDEAMIAAGLENPAQVPSVRLARKTLAELGVEMTAEATVAARGLN